MSGVTGGYASLVNGIYFPTSQFEDNWPVYKKVPQNHSENHHFHEMYLCFQSHHKKKRRSSSTSTFSHHSTSRMSPAWIIKNNVGVIYARIILHLENKMDFETNKFAIEKIQFNESGNRKDIEWEMRSSVGMLGFRKRSGGVIRSASMIELKLLPELKDGILDLCRHISQDHDQVLFPLLINLFY